MNASHPPVIKSDKLSVFAGQHQLLSDIDFQVASGELVGVIGPNGAGKSTLLSAIIGQIQYSGMLKLNGTELRKISVADRAKLISFVAQESSIGFDLTVREVVGLGALANPLYDPSKATGIVSEALETVGIVELASRRVTKLSGGERQLTQIARAIAQRTPVMLLDEPLAALDLHHQLNVIELLNSQTETGKAVVISIHDINLAARYCSKIALIVSGRLVAFGTPEDVLTDELVSAAYGITARVIHDPITGRLRITSLSNHTKATTIGLEFALW